MASSTVFGCGHRFFLGGLMRLWLEVDGFGVDVLDADVGPEGLRMRGVFAAESSGVAEAVVAFSRHRRGPVRRATALVPGR